MLRAAAPTGRSCSSFGALAGRALAQRARRSRRSGEAGPAVLHISRRARLRGAAGPRVAGPTTGCSRRPTRSAPRYCAADLVARARRRLGLGDRGRRASPAMLVPYPFATADHQAKNARVLRPRRRRDRSIREAEPRATCPELVRSLLGDPARLARDGRGDAARAAKPRRGRGDRRWARSRSRPLAGRRLWFVGIGGAGMCAYALLARAWGAEVGGWDRVETPYLEHARRDRGRRSRPSRRRRRPAGRRSSRPRTRAVSTGGRGPSSSPSSSRSAARSSSPARTARRRRRR